jgi:hypothetical protein
VGVGVAQKGTAMSLQSRRIVLLVLAGLISLLSALVAAWLVASTGAAVQTAILSGGGSFAATMTLAVLIIKEAGGFS